MYSIGAELMQRLVQKLGVRAELRVRRVAQAENGVADVGQRTAAVVNRRVILVFVDVAFKIKRV